MKLSLVGRTLVTGVVAALALAACDSGSDSSPSAASENKLEKTDIKVGALPVPDVAPLHSAVARGFFKQEGLNVKVETIQGTAAALPALSAGIMDIALFNYITAFIMEENSAGKFKIIADGFQAAPNTFVVMVPADSPLKTPQDLKGKTIAVPALKATGALATTAILKTVGVDVKRDGVKFVEIPFPNMPQALQTKQVDAVWLVEPFISAVQRGQGARKLLDTMSGPTADFPIAGWGASAEWIKKNPNTLAAFQRGLARAQKLAASDRNSVEQILPTYTRIDAATASIISLGTFPTTLNVTRLQRVADVMLEIGYLKQRLDVKQMINGPTEQ